MASEPLKSGKRPYRGRAVASLVILCLLYFVAGGIATLAGWLPTQAYLSMAGVVGGLASVLGLIALARPGLRQTDLEDLELQSLRKLADASDEIKQLERARLATKQEIDTLEARRREMEFLVRKASLSLFLQEQHRLYSKRIVEELAKNKDLEANLQELRGIDEKLTALDEEIEKDPNVDLLKDTIEAARRQPAQDERFRGLPPLTRAIFLAVDDLARILRRLAIFR